MKLGFTGTQKGMTSLQMVEVTDLLGKLTPVSGSHGDCVGSDAQFHYICQKAGIPIIIHPPKNPSRRAFCRGGTVLQDKDYLERNHDIVDTTDSLIATPDSFVEKLRSGTWATIRYAKKKGKRVIIVFPDGGVNE